MQALADEQAARKIEQQEWADERALLLSQLADYKRKYLPTTHALPAAYSALFAV